MGERGKADVNDAGVLRKKLVETLNIKLEKLFASVCSNKAAHRQDLSALSQTA